MKRWRPVPRTPLAPVERHRRSREALVERVMSLVLTGHSLATIARCRHMPRRATMQRWIERDAAVRARHETARRLCADFMADEVVRLADSCAGPTADRRRVAAVKVQIEARKWWIKTFAVAGDGQRGAKGGGAKRAGVSDADVAILQAALASMESGARTPADEDAASTAGAIDDTAPYSSSSPKGEDPRVSVDAVKTRGPMFVDGRAGARPEAAFADHDAKEETPDQSDNTDTGNLPSPAPAPLPLSDNDESDEPRYHRLPLTVAEEEALNAPRHGKPPPSTPAPPPEPPPRPFVPRWFNDDDLRRPEPPYDPFRW